MGVATARAKLLLFGEHAAVYGHPAVGLTLPWSLTVESVPANRWDLPDLGPHTEAVRALVSRLESIAHEEGLPAPVPCRLGFQTAIPLSSGFGSSGALCAALVSLFWPDQSLAVRDRLAWKAEGLFHGTPSGIDTCLALREGCWLLEGPVKPPQASPLPTPLVHLVVGALVRQGDTKSLVGGIARRKAEGDAQVQGILDRLGALATSAAQAIAAPCPERLPDFVNEARDRLRSLGLESPAMTEVLDGARATGALAGKLSGAGGGGAFFLLYPDQETAAAALPALGRLVPASSWTQEPNLVPLTAKR